MKLQFETPFLALSRWVPRRVLLALVVLLLFGYSAAIGVTAGLGETRLLLALLALPVAGIGLGFAGHYSRFLVLILSLTALTFPIFELGTGTASRLPLSLILTLGITGMWVANMYLYGWRLASSPLNVPLILFGIICVISLVWGNIWRDPILIRWDDFMVTQVGALMTILASLAAGLLIGNFIDRRWQIGFILGGFLVCGTLMTFSQMLRLDQRVLNDRGLWGLWYCAPLVGLIIAQPNIRWYWRLGLVALLGLHLYHVVIVNSLWVTGWLPTIVGIAAVVFLHSRKLFFTLLLIVALIGGPWVVGYVTQVTQDNVEEGGLERLELWAQNWRVVRDHWLFGTGPAGYAIYYMTFFRDNARSTHNNYLDILAQFGFVGLGLWLWFAGLSLWEGWRLITRAPPGLLRTTAIVATGGWFAAMASMMLGDWVLPFAYNQGIGGFKYTVYSWIFLGLLISLRQILAAEERATAEQEAQDLVYADTRYMPPSARVEAEPPL